ncbi:MAG: PhoH family protein [Candidatus Saccharibacteria bacterium]|nr:PhoH family protein [Candidatus Saccharibacteria bacterium]
MLTEALLAPFEEIPIVIAPGSFGTGKTYTAVGCGLFLATNNKKGCYERIFVVPRDANLGEEIGFLPGGQREKIMPEAYPIIDNIRSYLKNYPKKKNDSKNKEGELYTRNEIDRQTQEILEKYVEIVSLRYMGGRSIIDS